MIASMDAAASGPMLQEVMSLRKAPDPVLAAIDGLRTLFNVSQQLDKRSKPECALT
jgi:hypothetical protein